MFDPGVIVLCGSLVEQLRENDLFAKYLRDCLPEHLLDAQSRPNLSFVEGHEAQWRGAALIAWDPVFHERRNLGCLVRRPVRRTPAGPAVVPAWPIVTGGLVRRRPGSLHE